MTHFSVGDLEAGIDRVMDAPPDIGALSMIVRRPAVDQRETLESGELDLAEGLIGDGWRSRAGSRVGESPDPANQITVMSARVISLIAGEAERWPLAGDQLYVDFDISEDNLPPGTRVGIGGAVIEVSSEPHTGCRK